MARWRRIVIRVPSRPCAPARHAYAMAQRLIRPDSHGCKDSSGSQNPLCSAPHRSDFEHYIGNASIQMHWQCVECLPRHRSGQRSSDALEPSAPLVSEISWRYKALLIYYALASLRLLDLSIACCSGPYIPIWRGPTPLPSHARRMDTRSVICNFGQEPVSMIDARACA